MKIIELSGKWTLESKNGEWSVPATVPGDNVSALLAAGKIPDPYWADNELQVQWIGREDWVYSRAFEVDAAFFEQRSLFLNAENLDTVAALFLNGHLVLRTENMFRRYSVDVHEFLVAGTNTMRIEFASSERIALEKTKQVPYPIPTTKSPVESPHRNMIRKVPCHAGWDWGICLMVSGIYGDISLGATSSCRIDYVTTTQKHSEGTVEVTVEVDVESFTEGGKELEISLGGERVLVPIQLRLGANHLQTTVTLANPRLWWPAGYGEQPLYDLTVRVAGEEMKKRIGLRTVQLVTEEDTHGRSFLFQVNGVPIFCKGANWIPADALPQRQSREVVEDLLQSALAANMNMIRVWGGGQYEPDWFYDFCDEHGLLVWQDFMFACSLYPSTPDFLENVRQEVRHQIKRLRDHACIALWCGNNENHGAMTWYEASRNNRDRYIVDYDRLFEGVIGKTVDECDPTRSYWPCSPGAGRDDYSDALLDVNRGDSHYWGVWHEEKPFSAFQEITPRFCSEFGYQSFPSMDTIRAYAPEDEFNLTAPIMEYHQRSWRGNSRIIEMFSRYFRMPQSFEGFVYLSQVQQALAIKTAVEHWRRARPVCMGTLYWQLNDNWPVCSWSSIDYGGKWKLLHYVTKRFYAPLLVSAFQTPEGDVQIWAGNDRLAEADATITVEVFDFSGNLLRREAQPAKLVGGSSRKIVSWPVPELAPEPTKVWMRLTLESGGESVRNEHFFSEPKKLPLQNPEIAAAVEAEASGGFLVQLSCTSPAFYVSVQAEGIRGEFDDNCITLLPGEPRALRFAPKEPVTLEAFQSALRIACLNALHGHPSFSERA